MSSKSMPSVIIERMIAIGLLAYLYAIPLAETQDIKTWRADTNFLNPRNWEKEQLPCANDRVIFPNSPAVITMMPQSLTIGELVLPLNGEIIFPEKASIELTGGKREEECTGKDVYFQARGDYWYDPANWNITSDCAFPRTPSRRNAAVPHAFQVPCPMDKVRFPEKTTFQTHVIYPLTSVSSMEINGENYSQSDFDALLRSHVGSLLFPDSPKIRISPSPCTDETGCPCGNDGPHILPTICNQVSSYCPILDCTDPIIPTGSCCPICGAQIIIKNKPSFKMTKLMTLHESFLNKEEFRGVESFTGKIQSGDIQSTFVDGTNYKGLANKVAQKIHDVLTSEDAGLYQIRSVTIAKSEVWKSGVPTYDSLSGGISSGGVATLVIMFLVLSGLGAAYFIYKKKHIPGFNFARFDASGDKFELELGTTPHDELQPVDSPPVAATPKEDTDKGFDNPVYGTAVEEVSPVVDDSSVTKDYVENPMFMIFEGHDTEEKK